MGKYDFIQTQIPYYILYYPLPIVINVGAKCLVENIKCWVHCLYVIIRKDIWSILNWFLRKQHSNSPTSLRAFNSPDFKYLNSWPLKYSCYLRYYYIFISRLSCNVLTYCRQSLAYGKSYSIVHDIVICTSNAHNAALLIKRHNIIHETCKY